MDRVLVLIAVALTLLELVPSINTQDDFEYQVLPPVYNVGEPPASPVYYPPILPLSLPPSPKPSTLSPSSKPPILSILPSSPSTKLPIALTHKPSPKPKPKPTLPHTKSPALYTPSKIHHRRPHITPTTPVSSSLPKKHLPAIAANLPVRQHRPSITQKPLVGSSYGPVNNEETNHYSFKYDVDEDGAQYTHSEVSDGQAVSGFFSLSLPKTHHHDFTYVAG